MLSRVGILARGRKSFCELIENQSVLPMTQSIRWRKRRWAPINASKEFYVREPTPIDPEEWKELKREYDRYRIYMKSLISHFKLSLEQKEKAMVSDTVHEREEHEWAVAMEVNDQWNAETKVLREKRQSLEDAEKEQYRLSLMVAQEKQNQQQKQRATEQIIQEKEAAKEFISLDKLDEEIEKALRMEVNYNYAIDTEGNRYIQQPDGTSKVESGNTQNIQRYIINHDEKVKEDSKQS